MIQGLIAVAVQFWAVLAEMAPYLLMGFAAAGVLSVLISPKLIERHLGGRGVMQILKATLFGIPLPLCSCGVIPVSASLRRHGASKAATTGFLISTPQTGVDSIFVTYSLMGPIVAVFRPLAALVNGMIGGVAVHFLGGDKPVDLAAGAGDGSCGVGEAVAGAKVDSCGVDSGKGGKLARMWRYGFVSLPQDIGKALLVGLLLAGVIGVALPEDFFSEYAYFQTGIGAMLVMLAIGVPLYVCATASVPLAAMLWLKGMSPGAVLVFLMTGPATNAAAIAMIWKVMGPRTTIVYLASVAGTALAAGFALDGIMAWHPGGGVAPLHGACHDMAAMGWWQHASGAVLVVVLGYALVWPRVRGWIGLRGGVEGAGRGEAAEGGDASVSLRIAGMTCNHCANSVRRVLAERPGVESVSVDLAGGRAVVSGADLQAEGLCEAARSLGYKVEVDASGPGE